MLETAERFTPVEKEPAIRQFLLLVGGLRALGDATDPSAPADGDDDPREPGDPGGGRVPGTPDDPTDSGVPGDLDDLGSGRRPGRPDDPGSGEKPKEAPRDPRMVLDAYFLRSLTFAGYAPALDECARCGTPGTPSTASVDGNGTKPLVAFAVQAGGMVCAELPAAGVRVACARKRWR